MKYQFITELAAEKAYPVTFMCTHLKVSTSGYYDWLARTPAESARRRRELEELITAVFGDSGRTYGYRRVHAVLARSGYVVDDDTVRVIMGELGLVACQPRPWRPVTTDGDGAHRIPDLVGRDFTATAPGEKFVGDVTYIRTGEGWLYLATVIDCATKMIAGWSMGEHFRAPLLCAAIDMAATRITFAPRAIFHSDRGSNYTSYEFGTHLAAHDMRQSVGRTGVCWDNAMAESFFGALKNECVYRQKFDTREQARRAIVEYIEVFYNRKRIHSGLGYKTPLEVHTAFLNPQEAA